MQVKVVVQMDGETKAEINLDLPDPKANKLAQDIAQAISDALDQVVAPV